MPLKFEELPPEKLRRASDPEEYAFQSMAELPELDEIIGQERATQAIEFGIGIPSYGYNIFALGPTGSGKTTTIKNFLEKRAEGKPVPNDWCYVNNFEDSYQPEAICLPPGGAIAFSKEMDKLLDNLNEEIPQAFEGEEYRQLRTKLARELDDARTDEFKRLEAFVNERGFALLKTPAGLIIAPVVEDQILTPEQYEELDAAKKEEFEQHRSVLQEKLEHTMRRVREIEREAKEKLEELERNTISFAIGHFFDEIVEKHSNDEDVLRFLEAARKDVIEHREFFKRAQATDEETVPGALGAPLLGRAKSPLERYRVNVIVDNSSLEGAPVVMETNPTYHNILGRIEHKSEFGALVTDFSMIKTGALHRANGGYLVLDIKALLSKPFAWEALKRALRTKEVRIEELGQQYSAVSFVGLAPEPISLDIKVVLIGDAFTYYLLYAYDNEFRKLFKVRADFSGDMDRSSQNVEKYALFIHARCKEESLKECDLSAVARVVEYGSRLASDQRKLTTRLADIADLIREANYWADQNGNQKVAREDVQKAIDERIYRSSRVEERIQEEIERGSLLVDTEGMVVGQVNGLAVMSVGDYTFGKPSRITARTFLGQAGVVNIEREAKMSGRIHDKGVLILSGYLGGKYAQDKPLSLSASLTFEQLYEGVEGDSASSTELYALLSSLSGLPIRQGLAVTGSVNQRGEIQPIGGVNQKIEGFFDVCKARGLTGDQGVIIPARNVEDLMLREDVIGAVREGKFHIHPIHSIDEGISILTGVEAGEHDEEEKYPPGSVNFLVDKRLHEMALRLKEFGKPSAQKEPEEDAAEEPTGEPPQDPPG